MSDLKYDKSTYEKIDRPHVTYSCGWVCLSIMVSVFVFFLFDYKKSEDRTDIELKNIELKIKDKEVELQKLLMEKESSIPENDGE
jgi:hypothetical protein